MQHQPLRQRRVGALARSLLFASAIAVSATGAAQTISWPASTDGNVSYSPSLLSEVDFAQVETGESHVVAVTDDGALYTWGASNIRSQLGRTGVATTPSPVATFHNGSGQPIPTPVITKVAASNHAGFALDSQQRLFYWGTVEGSAVKARPTLVTFPATAVLDIAAAGEHGLIYGSSLGKFGLWSFGGDQYGELGVRGNKKSKAITSPANIAQEVAGSNSPAVAGLAAGTSHSVVLLADGRVRAFGRNQFGQLGDGTTASSSNKSPVVTGRTLDGYDMDAVQVEAGNDFTLVRSASGSVFAVGNNAFGLLNRESDPRFYVPVEGLSEVLDVSAGHNFALARTSDTVYRWGFVVSDNESGSVVSPSPVPNVSAAGVLEASNAPTPTSGPWEAFFQGSPNAGHLLSKATLSDVSVAPVFSYAVVYDAGFPDEDGIPSLSESFVRVYADRAAENGNGPTFTLVTDSPYAWFGSATLEDGQDYVDVPYATSEVFADTIVTFDIFSTTNEPAFGYGFVVLANTESAWVAGVSVDNLSSPGQAFKGGHTARLNVELAEPAGVGGTSVFVSSTSEVIPGGWVYVEEGETTGSLLRNVGRVNNYEVIGFSSWNPDFSEVSTSAEALIAEVLSIVSPDSVGGGTPEDNPGNVLTITLDSPPPVFGLPLDVDSSDHSVVTFLNAPSTLTSTVTTVDLATTPVLVATPVTLTVSVNLTPTTLTKTVLP